METMDRPATIRLIDQGSGIEHPLAGGVNAIGRSEDNDVCLPGGAVSRYHCEIRLEGATWIIEDQGSTYGTYLNGDKVEGSRPLKDGDTLRMGVTRHAPGGEFNLTFRIEAGQTAQKGGEARRKAIEAGRTVTERVGERLLVQMSGVFRRNEIDDVAADIRRELGDALHHVVLHLENVTYMNSYSLSILVDLAAYLKQRGGSLTALGATGSVRKLLAMPGDASPIVICDSEDDPPVSG